MLWFNQLKKLYKQGNLVSSQNPITNCKYNEWLKDCNFNNCKLNRGEYGEFLASYITGEHEGFVLNLNGGWGTGKTQFLRRLYSLLCSKGHPTIYIDAWESDFSEIPLSVIASELINQLSQINEDIGNEFDKAQEYLGKALKGTVIGGAAAITKLLWNEASIGSEAAKVFFEKSDQDFLKAVMSEHVDQIQAIKDIRAQLAQLTEVLQSNFSYELPVVVLVDELDRCRPNYAIEMLEVIKHFFKTNNFVFVIATDSEQLQHSIKSIYGSGFDSNVYLKRFFDREASLEKPNIEMYLSMQNLDSHYSSEGLVLYPHVEGHLSSNGLNDYITWISQIYNLSLRDIDQLISKLKACLRYAVKEFQYNKGKQYINIFTLLLVLVEMDTKQYIFIKNDGSYPEIVQLMQAFKVGKVIDPEDVVSKFNLFASLMVHCSNMHEVTHNDRPAKRNKTTVVGASDYYRIKTNGKNGIYADAFKEINRIYKEYSTCSVNSPSRFWLWDDYIKVSKLAGKLD